MVLLVTIGFAIWLLVTVVAQCPGKIPAMLRRYDYLQLIPRWTFFAPNPETSDFRLLVRYQYLDGNLGGFTEIALYEHGILRPLWNPARRNAKILIDSVHILTDLANHGITELERTVPYLLIKNFVKNLPKDSSVAALQFIIVSSKQSEPSAIRLLVASPLLAVLDSADVSH